MTHVQCDPLTQNRPESSKPPVKDPDTNLQLHSEGAEKHFGHASHWQHFKINLYCPKQCHVERSQSGLGSWPAA